MHVVESRLVSPSGARRCAARRLPRAPRASAHPRSTPRCATCGLRGAAARRATVRRARRAAAVRGTPPAAHGAPSPTGHRFPAPAARARRDVILAPETADRRLQLAVHLLEPDDRLETARRLASRRLRCAGSGPGTGRGRARYLRPGAGSIRRRPPAARPRPRRGVRGPARACKLVLLALVAAALFGTLAFEDLELRVDQHFGVLDPLEQSGHRRSCSCIVGQCRRLGRRPRAAGSPRRGASR